MLIKFLGMVGQEGMLEGMVSQGTSELKRRIVNNKRKISLKVIV